jgi:F-type H+-transporting ATPase subunit a
MKRFRQALLATMLLALIAPTAALAEDFDPEDEFNLNPWVKIKLGSLDLSINKAVAYLWLGTVVTILLGILVMRVRLRSGAPGRRQTIGEQIYEVAQVQIAEQGLPTKAIGRWFPYCATLLLFIWVVNMIGFIPLPLSSEKFHIGGLAIPTFGIYAATASLSVTLALSLMTFVFTHIEGVRFNGVVKYLRSLVPDVPKAMKPFIAVIEIISVFMRLISLSVRLFANMLAGHMLILVMIGLVFIIHTPPWRFFGLPGAVIFYLFEVIIVVSIQAFIFAALSAIYIGSAIEPDH